MPSNCTLLLPGEVARRIQIPPRRRKIRLESPTAVQSERDGQETLDRLPVTTDCTSLGVFCTDQRVPRSRYTNDTGLS